MVYTDNAGNYFLGDCIWGNHSIVSPLLKYLSAYPINSSFSSEFSSLMSSSGLNFRNVLSQSFFDSWLSGSSSILNSLVHYGVSGDINDRFAITLYFNWGYNPRTGPITLYNNSGSTNTTNSSDGAINKLSSTEYPTNAGVYGLSGGMQGIIWGRSNINTEYSPIFACGVADASSLGLFFFQRRLISGSGAGYQSLFIYGGKLDAVNTGFSYYNATQFTQSIIFSGGNLSFSSSENRNIEGRHYIANSSKYPLTTGDAQYPIVCSDGQNTTSQWATDFYVFDDNATLGYPAIGKVRNLLLAQGTYTIGKPVKLQGSVLPDNGFNRWLPVGTFAGKTVLMRCYSSVEI